ncbi:M91 family zinc metallopeptidase [Collimonas pratensis]|uniref:Type III effector HopAP1 domain protein n=1 Tax=Collimonas pratensis TaxID=279113 RepID=A0A127QAF4_9BURK|nr:M91 family zinc metallopeptidase [Collimonas pratensis]AMP07033.1 type III effector HopAP1 domain protein [Collimonas pratensis]
MRIPSNNPDASGSVEEQPLLPDGSSRSGNPATANVQELNLRTSRSNAWQTMDSYFSGLKPRAKVEPTGVPGVYVDHAASDTFKQKTGEALRRLGNIPTGRAVLKQVQSIHEMHTEKRVVIRDGGAMGHGSATAAAWNAPKHILPGFNSLETAVARQTEDPFMPFVAGSGVDTAVVLFNAEQGHNYADNPHTGECDASLAFVDLGHELIHANRLLHGAQYAVPIGNPSYDGNNPAAEEELRTTGVGPWRDEPISDNAMRRELGLTERASYVGNQGIRLRQPSEKNSAHTEQRLAELQASAKEKQS